MNSTSSNGDAAARQESSAQFYWLRQVAFDDDLAPIASRIAITLTKYFNRKNCGWTFMGQDRVAAELGVSLRTVNDALNHMVARGHLLSDRRGVKQTNRYHLVLKPTESDTQNSAHPDTQDFAHQEGVTRNFSPSDTQIPSKVIRKNLRTNPLREPIEKEPIEREESLRLDFVDQDSGRRSPSPSSDIDADFETWYRSYPKRVAKAAALKAYRAVITKELATVEELLDGVRRYDAERGGQDPKYTKHPTTWLNAGCWADEPAVPFASTTAPPGQSNHHTVSEQIARQLLQKDGGGHVH